MRNPRIHSPQILCVNSHVVLTDNAANHVSRVLRMRIGEPLVLFNGDGESYQAEIINISKKHVEVSLRESLENNNESPLRTELGQCLSRGERMDYAIQKATELGITDITLLFSARCEVKLNNERQEKRLHHWQQVAISACEQCGRNRIPAVHPPIPLEKWLTNRTTTLNFVLHHRTEKPLTGFERPDSVSLLIGPEGGLTATEIEQALNQGFHPLSLGPRVMRTETAPVAATAILQYLWGDWN